MDEKNVSDGSFTEAAELSAKKTATLEIMSINKTTLFNRDECDRILSTCIEELWLASTVIGDQSLHKSKRQKLRGDTAGFPFLNIRDVTKNANTEIYDFKLLGIIDQDFPQVYVYSSGDYYNLHVDLNLMAPSRKITFIVNLSDPSSYEGGEIEFLNVDISAANIEEQGSCLIFPSYVPYKINQVVSGTKHIIVGHVHGALFR